MTRGLSSPSMPLSLLAMEPRLEQDFALPVVASLAWLQVFDLFLGTQAMTMVSTRRTASLTPTIHAGRLLTALRST